MEFVKRTWAQIWLQVNGMSPSQKWLVGFVVITMLLSGALVLLFVNGPSMQPIGQFTSEQQPEAVAKLRAAGIRVSTENGQIMVPGQERQQALSILLQNDLLGSNFSQAFDEMIAADSIFKTERTKDREFLIAKCKYLNKVISGIAAVKRAETIITPPQEQGFASTYEKPSSSVMVWMNGRKRVNKELVEAIAGLVSGAMAELDMKDIEIVDANHGKRYTPGDPDQITADDAIETRVANERQYLDKIETALSYIPGVLVTVNVNLDNVARQQVEGWGYMETEPLKRTHAMEQDRKESQTAGEPGVRSNTGLTIDGGGFEGTSETVTEKEEEFNDKQLTEHRMTVETGHQVKTVSAAIGVPRSYFVAAYKMLNPTPAAADGEATPTEPDEATLSTFVTTEIGRIEQKVQRLITTDNPGQVTVDMIPDMGTVAYATGVTASGEVRATGIMGFVSSDWAQPAVLLGLGMISLAMMFHMVRKATRQPDLPSVEELAGIPPSLPTEEDLIGEAEEHEAALDGVELDEEEIRHRKMAEQIGEMINNNPEEAGILFKKWVASE